MPSIRSLVEEDLARQPKQEKIDVIVNTGKELRTKILQKADLEEQARDLYKQISEIKFHTLPELMSAAGVDRWGLPAQGNQPAADLMLKPYYKANIAESWSDDEKTAAFTLLDTKGHGDIIKNRFVIDLPRGEKEAAALVRGLLEDNGIDFIETMSVPWKSLTALVREQTEDRNPFTPAELNILGATVGRIADIKERG